MGQGSAKLKVCLAHLATEAHERANIRDYEFQLEVKWLEVAADKEICIRQLELEAGRIRKSPVTRTTALVSAKTSQLDKAFSPLIMQSKKEFDLAKVITLIPQFRETEVNAYFVAFEQIAVLLGWPKEMWALMLQCRLTVKAQEACTALSVNGWWFCKLRNLYRKHINNGFDKVKNYFQLRM